MTSAHGFRIVQNTRQPEPESRRNPSLEITLGIGILILVFSYCLDSFSASGILPSRLPSPSPTVFVLYLFQMPLFFAVSGCLAWGTRRSASSTFARLLPSLAYPYLLWSFLRVMATAWLPGYTETPPSIDSLYQILWAPLYPYWLLYALFFCQVGYLAIRRLSSRAQLIVAAILFVAPQFFLNRLVEAQLLIVLEIVRGFLYFVLGAIAASQVRQLGRWIAIAATVLFALFAILEYQALFAGASAAPAALPAGIAGVIATLSWSRMMASRGGWPARVLAFCGRYWIGICVMHIFVVAAARIALERLPARLPATPAITAATIAAATVLGVALPLSLHWIASKLSLDRWLGLPRMEAK